MRARVSAVQEPSDSLSLDRQVCFALYAASRGFTDLYRSLLGDLGLTYPQYLAMLALWEHGSLAVKDLGAQLRLDSGTLSPLLKRLESAGLVQRRRSGTDERSVLVEPTAAGSALRERAAEVPRQVLAAAGMTVDELASLRAALDRLTANVDRAARLARRAVADGEPVTPELLRAPTAEGD